MKKNKKKRHLKYSVKNTILIILLLIIFFTIGFLLSRRQIKDETVVFDSDKADKLIYTEPVYQRFISFRALDEGYDIYNPKGSGYRYGPSMIRNDDGSVDLWAVSPGNNSTMWDYIVYRHLDNNGNWSKEKTVLKPTANSDDCYSTCDPGVIYFNGYYYLGYTSTSDKSAKTNQLFVARSTNPAGPYEKWNGEGWGGKPKPIIPYEENDGGWGAGEPSFVIKDDTLYIYYSYNTINGSYTCVATADTSDNWPATIKSNHQIVFVKDKGQDSFDVVYIDEIDSFLAIAPAFRMTDSSGIITYQSDDGFDFHECDTVKYNLIPCLHNIGISKNPNGHVSIDNDLCLSYAYAYSANSKWGVWPLHFQTIRLTSWEEAVYPEQESQ